MARQFVVAGSLGGFGLNETGQRQEVIYGAAFNEASGATQQGEAAWTATGTQTAAGVAAKAGTAALTAVGTLTATGINGTWSVPIASYTRRWYRIKRFVRDCVHEFRQGMTHWI